MSEKISSNPVIDQFNLKDLSEVRKASQALASEYTSKTFTQETQVDANRQKLVEDYAYLLRKVMEIHSGSFLKLSGLVKLIFCDVPSQFTGVLYNLERETLCSLIESRTQSTDPTSNDSTIETISKDIADSISEAENQ